MFSCCLKWQHCFAQPDPLLLLMLTCEHHHKIKILNQQSSELYWNYSAPTVAGWRLPKGSPQSLGLAQHSRPGLVPWQSWRPALLWHWFQRQWTGPDSLRQDWNGAHIKWSGWGSSSHPSPKQKQSFYTSWANSTCRFWGERRWRQPLYWESPVKLGRKVPAPTYAGVPSPQKRQSQIFAGP